MRVAIVSKDVIKITGHVGAENVEGLKREVLDHFQDQPVLCIDLSGIKGFNTMLLAVLCAWVRFAREHKKTLSFKGVGSGMRAIADLSQIGEWLFGPVDENKDKMIKQ